MTEAQKKKMVVCNYNCAGSISAFCYHQIPHKKCIQCPTERNPCKVVGGEKVGICFCVPLEKMERIDARWILKKKARP